jgi:hypothetical protein
MHIGVEMSKCELKDSFSRTKMHTVVATLITLITESGFFTGLLVQNRSAYSPFIISKPPRRDSDLFSTNVLLYGNMFSNCRNNIFVV